MAPDTVLANLLETATALLESQPSRPTPGVQIGSERFRLLVDRHRNEGWVLVLLQSDSDSGSMSDAELKYRYGLTEREIEVARLLAERQSNKEIARLLGVTIYTAGRHTERILGKLKVTSRREVRDVIRAA
jgi:DNA-binding CsgD family transcriptional regulator